MHFWLRDEDQQETLVSPSDCKTLLESGHSVTVEESTTRIFANSEYELTGAKLAPSNAWHNAPPSQTLYIIGTNEPTVTTDHNHICFSDTSSSKITNLSELCDEKGEMIIGYGGIAGFVGAGLGLLAWINQQTNHAHESVPIFPNENEFVAYVKIHLDKCSSTPTVGVIGPNGKCGRGAIDLLSRCGITPTTYTRKDTKKVPVVRMIENVQVLINMIQSERNTKPFFNLEDVANSASRALSVIVDVSCDTDISSNPLPFVRTTTSLESPCKRYIDSPALDVICIENLTAVLPRETSEGFSRALLPTLLKMK
jgi:saccharopine dehydrogenase (NAD+, L-lysine-forming)